MAVGSGSHVINLLRVTRMPIYSQLVLEEALLRNTKQNWMVLNDGAFQPAIVMGISGRPDELVDVPAALAAGVQVIKRFTGGGTVVVDHDTVFASLIFQGDALPHVDCYPRPIMSWTEGFYRGVFQGLAVDGRGFALRENDYVFGAHKFGGNAQSITGRRWLHHTSLLWDYQPHLMALLRHPKRAPDYRKGRDHTTFLKPLSHIMGAAGGPDVAAARAALLGRLTAAAHGLAGFTVRESSISHASHALAGSPLCGTRVVDLAAHVAAASGLQNQAA